MKRSLLTENLDLIIQTLRRQQAWRGLTQAWVTLTLVSVIAFLIRYFWELSVPHLLPLLLAASAVSIAAILVRAWQFKPDYVSIAREIESHHPGLRSALVTAVEQKPDSATGEFNFLQERVIAHALEQNFDQKWNRSFQRQARTSQRLQWVTFLVFTASLVTLRAHPPGRGNLARRVPFAVHVTPEDATVERGTPLVILARFDGKVPAEAKLVVAQANQPEQSLPLARNLSDPVFGGTIKSVQSDLVYRIEFPGGQTRNFKVNAFDYPNLDHADAKITFPAYTHLAEKTITDTRRLSAVEGSTLDFSFYLNKPVVSARLVARDKSSVNLVRDSSSSNVFHTRFVLDQNRRYELLLADAAGRTNRLPPEFVLAALTNAVPSFKINFPQTDPRVSALDEMRFDASLVDDFGLISYGIAYSLAGQDEQSTELGQNSGPQERRNVRHRLALEDIGAKPGQVLSYYFWAVDLGPDGHPRRTTSDISLAEIKPFDEVFRENQNGDSSRQQGSQSQQSNEADTLIELQRNVTLATWNLIRRASGAGLPPRFEEDTKTIRQSQTQAVVQLQQLIQRLQNPTAHPIAEKALHDMQDSVASLGDALGKSPLDALKRASKSQQLVYQGLLNLESKEFNVARAGQTGQGKGNRSRAQRQVDELDLKQADNKYENQRQAAANQTPERREDLQVSNRLKELAQRQQDLNEKLKELQAALNEARTEQEREAIQNRLKRLKEEEQEMLSDVDELAQRMDRPENQSRMTESRRELDKTRSDVQKSEQALEQNQASQALAAGTRAQRDLQSIQENFRKQTSSQFSDQMRKLREDAHQLAQKQQEISKRVNDLAAPTQRTLRDSGDRAKVTDDLVQQKSALTNLFSNIRQISEQAEDAEPLLFKQLYDTLRQSNQEDIDQNIDNASALVKQGFASQAGEFEKGAEDKINQIDQQVSHAAESVLGDETEALRMAEKELQQIGQELAHELAQAGSAGSTNNGTADPTSRQLAPRVPADGANSRAQSSPDQAQSRQNPSNQAGSGSGGQVDKNSGQTASDQGQARQASSQAGRQSGVGRLQTQAGSEKASRQNGNRPGGRSGTGGQRGEARDFEPGGGGGMDENGSYPLTGESYVEWSDRLRDVEEMVDQPDLRTSVAAIRDRARAIRLEYKRFGKKPDWAVVKSQIATPLAEVQARVAEELARRESKDALVPIDRDPVPSRYSELVRRYYEKLGKE